jgi:predicted esterase
MAAERPSWAKAPAKAAGDAKSWCAPEVSELLDHVCYADGGVGPSGERTLVIYLHGLLAESPGFQYLQHRVMALHAKRLGFTVLLPTAPHKEGGYAWPNGKAAQEKHEADVIGDLHTARTALAARLGRTFDHTFVVGFSSGAYYASSLALRGALDVDGYILLAGAGAWVRPEQITDRRAPVFVGISAADKATAGDSRGFAGTLASLGWPYRAEARSAGHMVDWKLIGNGIAWLRARAPGPAATHVR